MNYLFIHSAFKASPDFLARCRGGQLLRTVALSLELGGVYIGFVVLGSSTKIGGFTLAAIFLCSLGFLSFQCFTSGVSLVKLHFLGLSDFSIL